MREDTPVFSTLAETLIGSEIVKLAGEIREQIKQGKKIYNFTIGDFDPQVFPIPALLEEEILASYRNRNTNYPAADGELELRTAVSSFVEKFEGISYTENEVLIAAGGRPLIYTIYRALVNKGDRVIYAVPSWNNNHYVHFTEAEHCVVEAKAENHFMPTAEEIKPFIAGASLLALCSPQNPTGTTFTRQALLDICTLVLEENKRRAPGEKKLYLLFDQMYWTLTYGSTQHFNPVSLLPELKEYTVFVDGISKSFAATGVRVGWSLGPAPVIAKMKAILSHLGAWSPMAEQKATAKFLQNHEAVADYLGRFKQQLEQRLVAIYNGLMKLKEKGFQVNAIAPQAAIYLTVQLDLKGKITKSGSTLSTQKEVTAFLLQEASLALVPFAYFGTETESAWYRLSVGTSKMEDIPDMLMKLENALGSLQNP